MALSGRRWVPSPPDPGLAGALLLGAASVLVGLGASSLFVDEVYSWQAARLPLGEVHAKVLADEVAPDTYYLALHAWIRAFGDGEWIMRLPSAVAAIALVAAVWWLAAAIDRRAAASAAVLCALSPLVLQYGQQVRSYVFAMLAVTLAAGAAIRCAQAAGARRRAFFWAAVALCVAAFWINYTSAVASFPILLWLLVARDLVPARERFVGVGAAVAICAALLPQALHQLRLHPAGLEGFAGMTFRNLTGVVGAPFDGRVSAGALPQAIAAVLCAAALAGVLSRRSGRWAGARGLALLAALPIVALIVRTLAGADVLASRYVAVAAPLVIVVVALWATRLPAALRLAVVALLAGIALAGSIRSHLPEGHDSDVRALSEHVAEHASPGEAIVVSDVVGLTVFSYYLPRALPPGFPALTVHDPRVKTLPGMWLVTRPGVDPDWPPEHFAALFAYPEARGQRTFPANAPYAVTHLTR